jgi:putative transposase
MIDLARQAAAEEGVTVSMTKLCQWLGIPRRSAYYRSQRSAPKVQPRFVEPIKAMIEENRSFDYSTVAHLLNFNKNSG